MIQRLDPSDRKFVWDCTVLVEEEELERYANGGSFYQLKKD